MSNSDTNFYSISSISPLTEFLPLAPKQREGFIEPQCKKEGYIADMLVPPDSIYDSINVLKPIPYLKRKIRKKVRKRFSWLLK